MGLSKEHLAYWRCRTFKPTHKCGGIQHALALIQTFRDRRFAGRQSDFQTFKLINYHRLALQELIFIYMHQPFEFSPKLFEACRRHAEAALGASPRDPVQFDFDWEIPRQQDNCITFQVLISRRNQLSTIDFAIDLRRLKIPELQKLHDFLPYPPKCCWPARSIAWLLRYFVEPTNAVPQRGDSTR
jgi:hypothetical protein